MFDKISTIFNSFINVQNKKSAMPDKKKSTIFNIYIIVQNKKSAMSDEISTTCTFDKLSFYTPKYGPAFHK